MNLLYLFINIFSILIPFLFSFHPRLLFYKRWRTFLPSMVFTAMLFLMWDEYFTRLGIWGFNEAYLTGIYLYSLPLEEILFFIAIPYACVFTYHCFEQFGYFKPNKKLAFAISISLIVFLSVIAFYNLDRLYTAATCISLAVCLSYIAFIAKPDWLLRFYGTYIILLFPFFIVNGLLTGSMIENEVVWYNDLENAGFRLATVPFEDIFYGMELILLNVFFMHLLERKFKNLISK